MTKQFEPSSFEDRDVGDGERPSAAALISPNTRPMPQGMRHISLAAAIAAFLVGAAMPAAAGCFQPLGCTDNDFFRLTDLMQQRCEILWKMRNTILKERGYCFEKEREIAVFGNAGCRYQFANTVLFHSVERDNLANIASVEKAKRCPR